MKIPTDAHQLFLQALVQLEEHLLSNVVEFPSHLIDPSPFQLVEMTSLNKVCSVIETVLFISLVNCFLYRHTAFSLCSHCHMRMSQVWEN